MEFDSDLYDQWAGEVTTLLTDDVFDAESTRPVQNAVLTAWKDTVPLDANLVHKSGNETIAGNKTFTARMFVREPFIPSIHVVSETAYTATGLKGLVGFFDQKDGSSNEAAGIYTSIVQGETDLGLRVHKPDRSGQFDTIFRVYSDHALITIPPYYPVDGSSNPQPLTANALVTSGNVAVDPRIVHTTGNETVAGGKTFTATMNIKGTAQLVPRTVYDAGTPSTYYGWKGRISIVDKKDGVESTIGDILCTSVQTYGEVSMRAYKPDRSAYSELRLRDYADFQSLLIPSHYPTSNGNPVAPAEGEAMSSGMIAVDPRIVHTTGNETVAGNKTFTGYTFIDNPRFKRSNQTLHGNAEWVKFYEFLPVSYGGFAVIRVTQTYYIYGWIGAEIRIRQGTPTANPDAKFYNMSGVVGKLAKRASDGVVEVWMQNTTTNNLGVMADMVAESGGSMKVATAVSQTAPAVGDTYSVVVDIANA